MQATNTRIVWFEKVEKISRKHVKQPRTLAVATPGIFLFTKRIFPSTLKLSRLISFGDLEQLEVTSNSVIIVGRCSKMEIEHPYYMDLAAAISAVYYSLFGTSRSISSPSSKQKIDAVEFEFTSPSPLADRFLSYCSTLSSPYTIDQVNDVCKALESSSKSVTFSAEISVSPISSALVNAVMKDASLERLIIHRIYLPSFMPHMYRILKHSSSISMITYSKVSFAGTFNDLSDFFRDVMRSPIQSISFKDCDMTETGFTQFIESFGSLNTGIHSLSIDNCTVNEKSLETLFFSILTHPCFRSLEEFSLTRLSDTTNLQLLIMQLMNCDWVLTGKTLKTINLMGVDASSLLPILTMFETGLTTLSLTRSTFLHVSSPISFGEIRQLDLSETSFESASLVTLLESISKSSISVLILDGIIINNSSEFYRSISNITLHSVEALSWNNNELQDEDIRPFMEFIIAQPSLIDLSISRSLGNTCKSSIPEICLMIGATKLERLVLKGAGNYSFGKEFTAVLTAVLTSGTIKSLDVSGHSIDDKGLVILNELVTKGMDALVFSGSQPHDIDALFNLLETIANSSIQYSQWPESDLRRILSEISGNKRDSLAKKASQLKKLFAHKFGDFDIVEETNRRRSSSVPVQYSRHSSEQQSMLQVSANILGFRDNDTTKLLSECVSSDILSPKSDPLVKAIKNIESESSITNATTKLVH